MPFSYENIEELYKTQREVSRNSEYFKGLLRTILLANTLVPGDLKKRNIRQPTHTIRVSALAEGLERTTCQPPSRVLG